MGPTEDMTDLVEHFDHRDPRLTAATAPELYARLREQRVRRSDRYGGFWVLTRYEHAVRVLRDHDTFSSAEGVFLVRHPGQHLAPPLEFDPPLHSEYRALTTAILAPRHLASIEPDLRTMVRALVAELSARGGGDIVSSIAVQVPLQTVLRLIGIDVDKFARIRALTEQIHAENMAQSGTEGVQALFSLLAEEVAWRRAEPRDDFLTRLLEQRIQGQLLSDEQVLLVTAGLAVAGHETTMNAAGALVCRLASDVDLQQRLRAEPRLVPGFVEESLRLDSPVHLFFRTVTTEVEIDGQALAPGDRVLVIYASANHDEAKFDDARSFRLDRSPNRHLAFGSGIHYCVGAQLARLELRVLTEELLARPGLALAEPPTFAGFTAGGHFAGPTRGRGTDPTWVSDSVGSVTTSMRRSVNPICSVSNTLAEDLDLWRAVGVTAAGLLSRKVAAHGWQRTLDDVRAAGVAVPYLVHGIATPVDRAADWRRDEQELLVGATRVAAQLGATSVYLCTGPSGGLLFEAAAAEFERRMAPVLDVARDLGVRIAIENNHSSRPELGFVFSVADAAHVARRLGMGICVDLYCCWLERALGDTLRRNVDLIDLVQVSDFTVGTLTQPDRVVPGDADLPLRRCLELVVAAGYHGYVDLELLGPTVEAEGYAARSGAGSDGSTPRWPISTGPVPVDTARARPSGRGETPARR